MVQVMCDAVDRAQAYELEYTLDPNAGPWTGGGTFANHQIGQRLELELIDLPFPSRSYRLRINGAWAKKLPVASKSEVMRQLRGWWVAH